MYLGTLTPRYGVIGHGAFKIVEGECLGYTPNIPGAKEINLGPVGTTVTAKINPQSPHGLQTAQRAMQLERTNWEQLAQSQTDPSQGRSPIPGLRRGGEQTSAEQLQQEAIPFVQDIYDVVEIIPYAPEDILPRQEKTVMLLYYLYNSASVVEAFHALRVNGIPVTHGDLGDVHLANIASSAMTGDTYVIDYSHARTATKPEDQPNERIGVQNLLTDLIIRNPHLFDDLPDAKLIPSLLLDRDYLRKVLSKALQQVALSTGKPYNQLGEAIQRDYFLAYLWDKLRQNNIRLNNNRAYVEALAQAIDDYYQPGDTQELSQV